MPASEKLPPNPLLATEPRHVPERALLRRLAGGLGEVLTPIVPATGLVGTYRTATAPAPLLALLDYLDALEQELLTSRRFYVANVQALLAAWQQERPGPEFQTFFDLKCRELTGQPLPSPLSPAQAGG